MAMEKRQQQIQVGAGLTESRYSQDFIDLLKNWSMPVLLLLAVAILGTQGWKYLKARRIQGTVAAFSEYEAAAKAGNPAGLVRVAEEHEGVEAVPLMARLAAADLYAESAYVGIQPGAQVTPEGKVAAADVLTPEQVKAQLDSAATQYRAVLTAAEGKAGMEQHAISAAYGLASVAETRGEWDEAGRMYDRVINLSEKAGLPLAGKIAKERAGNIDAVKGAKGLLSAGDVKTAYTRVKVRYDAAAERLTEERMVEPQVMNADGTGVYLAPSGLDFEPAVLKVKKVEEVPTGGMPAGAPGTAPVGGPAAAPAGAPGAPASPNAGPAQP
ncbi:hypothetical protein BH11PLA1_BH11PLA1_03790 [soil metagenome]